MSDTNGSIDTAAMAEIPLFEVKAPKKERRGAGFPWFPNFAAIQGQGLGVHALALVGSKFGLVAALGSLALGSAAVGVTMRNDDVARRRTNAKNLTQDMRQTSAAKLAAEQGLFQNDQGNLDGMAYIRGGGSDGGAGAGAGDGAGGSASVSEAGGAAGRDGAKDGSGSGTGDGAKDGSGASPADAMAAALAGAAGQGAAAAAAGRPQLAKMQGFGGSGSMSGGGGGGMGLPQASLGGRTSGIREGVDASVRQAAVGRAGRERLVSTGRRTSGINSSQSMDRLAKMAPTMSANRTGTEAAQSAHSGAWDAAKPAGVAVSGPGAFSPSAGGSPTTGGGISTGEGGPVNMGGGSGSSASNVPEIPAYKNATPYQWAVDIAKIIMLLVMVLSIVSAVIKKWGGPTALGYLPMIYKITAALGAILALLGIYMLAMGQFWQGTIWTVLGGAVAIMALSNLDDSGKAPNEAAKQSAASNAKVPEAQLNGSGGGAPATGGGGTAAGGGAPAAPAGPAAPAVPAAPAAPAVPAVSAAPAAAPVTAVANTGTAAVANTGTAAVANTGTAAVANSGAAAVANTGAAAAGTSFGAANLIGAGAGAAGFATSSMANHGDTDWFRAQEKENYKKKYGIDPDTNRVINKEKFDAKYGKGAADRWNREHQNLD